MALYQIANLHPHLKHPEKYIAENKTIQMRSGWEISFVIDFLDKHTSVLSWTSEELIIPYFCQIRKNVHRYFPDFTMTVKEATGNIKTYVVEIKPDVEVHPPKVPKRQTKTFKDRCDIYIKNQCKWEAAREYCKKERLLGKNIEFVVMTEKGIYYEDGRFESICFFRI